MAGITVVQSVTAAFPQGNPGNTATPTLTGVASGNAICVATFGLGINTSTPAITVNDGNAYTRLAAIAALPVSNHYSMVDISLLTNVSSGTHNVVATNTAGTNASFGWSTAIEISGLTNTSTLDTSATAASSPANPATGNTSVVQSTNEIAIATFAFRASGTTVITGPGGSWANLFQNTDGDANTSIGSVDYLTPVALTAQSASWNPPTGATTWTAAIVLLKGVAAPNTGIVGWIL